MTIFRSILVDMETHETDRQSGVIGTGDVVTDLAAATARANAIHDAVTPASYSWCCDSAALRDLILRAS